MRRHLNYANVMATVAVFVALGGSSYAAITLSKNSVRSKHIKNGQVKRADLARSAVDSARVKDGSLKSTDFGAGQLPAGPAGPKGDAGPAGAKGDTGATGPTGPAGERATRLWAVVESGGAIARGEGVTGVTAAGGQYRVKFDRDIRNCAYLATTGASSNSLSSWSSPPEGAANTSFYFGDGGLVFVETYSASTGALTPMSFHLAVFCP